jgi:gustatory receptor
MTFTLLSLHLRLGYCLALTPSPSEVKATTWRRKLYVLFLSSFISTGAILYIIKNNFYRQFLLVKMVVCLLRDISLWSLSCYGMLVLGIGKQSLWLDLTDNLKKTKYLVQVKNSKTEKIKELAAFAVVNLLQILMTSYIQYAWYQIGGVAEFLQHEVVCFEIFFKYFYKYLLYVIICMLLVRYRGLKLLLETCLKEHHESGCPQGQVPTSLIRNVQYAMSLLHKTVNIFNDMFGWPMLLIIVYTTLEVLNNIDYIIFYGKQTEYFKILVSDGIIVFWSFVRLFSFVIWVGLLNQLHSRFLPQF